MPGCEPCSRFLSPATVTADGRCPSCDRIVEPGRARAGGGRATPLAAGDVADVVDRADPADRSGLVDSVGTVPAAGTAARDGLPPIPWHFKALCGAATLYLGWRAVQGIEWVAGRL